MLLSLLGYPTSRGRALSLFQTRQDGRKFTGIDLDRLASIVGDTAHLGGVRWHFEKRFTFSEVLRQIRCHLASTRAPTLIWFGATYRNVAARHIAVAVAARRGRIDLLDSLGPPPSAEQAFNVSIAAEATAKTPIRARGAPYQVNSRMAFGVLRWRQIAH